MRVTKPNRNGAVVVLVCFLMLPLLALLALSVDYGFLIFIRTDMQRAADNAVVAAVRELVPDSNGYQDLDEVRQAVREYVESNLGDSFSVLDSDIEIGMYDTTTIYSSIDLLNSGIYDTVKITLRRSDLANSSITLYFAQLFGSQESDIAVTSSAILQKGRYLGPGSDILPIGFSTELWSQLDYGDSAVIYGNGQIQDEYGNNIPGNWGTLDIGSTSNSSSDLWSQIRNVLSQDDLDSLEQQNVIPSSDHIDSQATIVVNGDTGFSAGIKHGINAEMGKTKLMPIYSHMVGHGGNLEYTIVGWAAVKLVDAYWQGSQNSRVHVEKSYLYDKDIRPNPDISDDSNVIAGVYTSPVLIQ